MSSWDRAALVASPIHASVVDAVSRLPQRFPTADDLNALTADRDDVVSGGGHAIRFAPIDPDEGYEVTIHRGGVVPTRPDNLHDLFNALAWLAFPRTKAALNLAHVTAIERGGARGGTTRGVLRDTATLFDEGGAIIACADPALARLLREHDWRGLFVARRSDLACAFRCLVFGHAVMEKGVRPYRGITAKALVINCDAREIALPLAEFRALVDERAAAFFSVPRDADIASVDRLGRAWKAALTPLPVLGLPGWDPANEDPAYYDDVAHFRPKRPSSSSSPSSSSAGTPGE